MSETRVRPDAAAGVSRRPGGRRRPPLWRLAPWRLAPVLGLRAPAAVIAVLVTTAVLACAVASAPLFLSSARSAALQQQLAGRCAEVGWAQTGVVSALADPQGRPLFADSAGQPPADEQLMRAWRQAGHEPEPVLATALIGRSGPLPFPTLFRRPDGAALSQPATLFYRPDALDHVSVLEGADGAPGVWLPESVAGHDAVRAGDQVALGDQVVPVAGVYRDLHQTAAHDPFWCDYRLLFFNAGSGNRPPPAMVLVSDPATFYRLATVVGAATRLQQVRLDPAGLSSEEALALLAMQQRLLDEAGVPARGAAPTWAEAVPNDRLPDLLDRAGFIEGGLHGTVLPVAVAGGVLAMVLVGAAGGAWAGRRAAEVRLLASRGVGPVALAGKAGLELALPALAGAGLGWAAARALVGVLGPADDLDEPAVALARGLAGAALLAALLCASTVAGLAARGTVERPVGAAPRWPAAVPWELALLAGAGVCWALLQHRPGVTLEANVAQVDGLLVAFPLLAIAGTAALAARGLTRALPALRRRAGRRGPAVFLAVNRMAAARGATAVLLAAVTLPIAVLGYTATLTATSGHTVQAKIGVQIGAEAAVTTVSRIEPTPAVRAAGTYLLRFDGSAVTAAGDRVAVQVLAVDPATFARTAYWDASFADQPLDRLVAALQGPALDGRLPAVAAGLPTGDPQLRLGRLEVPAQVVATARLLPGRRSLNPVVYVAADRLPDVPASAGSDRTAEIWTSGPLAVAVTALADAGGRIGQQLEPAGVAEVANFLGITWTFGYLSALAVFVGVVATGGLLLHLEARSRSRVSGYVMARRLGLTRAAHLRSLLVELGGAGLVGLLMGGALAAGAVAAVYRRLDVDQLRLPTPLLAVPWWAAALTAGAAALVVLLAALYAQHAADRAHPAAVLREDA